MRSLLLEGNSNVAEAALTAARGTVKLTAELDVAEAALTAARGTVKLTAELNAATSKQGNYDNRH